VSAPTRDEILAIINQITQDWPKDNERPPLEEAVRQLFTAIAYQRVDWALPGEEPDPDELGNHVWTDLGPIEAAALQSLVAFAERRAYARARAVIVEEVVAAAEAFSRQHPGARRQEELVPA
jgi:hypothetical protein